MYTLLYTLVAPLRGKHISHQLSLHVQ